MRLSEAYKELGLTDGASKEDAKKAFRKLAAKYHPDNKETGNEEQFKKINQAQQVIDKGETEQNMPGPSAWGINLNDLFNFSSSSGRSKKRIISSDITLPQTLTFKEAVIGCTKDITYRHNVKC